VKKFLFFSFLAAAACTPAMAQTQQPIRIKCGGSAYTDSLGQAWQADYGFNGGRTGKYNGTVSGTTDPKLYQTDRLSSGTPLVYSFPVVTGTYHVNLYFAETNSMLQRIGARVFNVQLEGNIVFQNLDIYAAAGANNALVRGADVLVTDGRMNIELDNVVQNAEIDAIEIIQTVAMPQMRLTFIYPDGTPVAGSLNYQITPSAPAGTTTTSAVSIGGSQPLVSGQATCLLLNSPQVLGLVGPLNVNLSLTDGSGNLLWQVVLAMNPSNINFTGVESTTLQVVVQKH